MPTGTLRLVALGALLVAAAGRAPASEPSSIRISGADYVGLDGIAAAFGMRTGSSVTGRDFWLADRANRVDFGTAADLRETTVNGLHVFLGDPVESRDERLYVSRIDFERRLAPLLRPERCGPPPPRPRIIAIDPGHGGSDPGMQNFRLGIMEKTYTLDVALRLKRLLELQGDRVVMTRVDDRAVAPDKRADLQRRPEMANLAHADLFISIHFNADPRDSRTSGTEIFTFPPQFQRSDPSWSNHQDDSLREVSPANRQDRWNVVFAHALHRELIQRLHTVDRGEKMMHLAVLRPLQCPGVLVESAFLSNDAEARRVATPAFQQQIAEAMQAGINDYAAILDTLRPPAPLPRAAR